jgi:hypothetical protein
MFGKKVNRPYASSYQSIEIPRRSVFEWFDGHIGLFFLLFCVAIIVLVCVSAVREDSAWAAFAKAHHCRVVERKAGYLMPTVVSTGKSVGVGNVYVPDQTAYACDDGVTYWRN